MNLRFGSTLTLGWEMRSQADRELSDFRTDRTAKRYSGTYSKF